MEKTRKIYCFLGLPGSGKGTQAEILAEKVNATILGMGDLIRKEIENADLSDPFYKEMKEKYDKGIPQPDDVAIDIIKKNIVRAQGSIILDNFPFTKEQSDRFFDLCDQIGVESPVCVWVKLTPESALQRILNRKVCSSCKKVFIGGDATICEACGGPLVTRSDDKEEVVKNRIAIYKPRIDGVVEVFRSRGTLIEINGDQSIPAVEAEIDDKVVNAKA